MWKTRYFPANTSIFVVEKPVETVDKGAFSVLCDIYRDRSHYIWGFKKSDGGRAFFRREEGADR